MSHARLQELTKLIDELYVLGGVDVNNMSTCSVNATKYGNTHREQHFIYYSLRVKADPGYDIMVQKYNFAVLEE